MGLSDPRLGSPAQGMPAREYRSLLKDSSARTSTESLQCKSGNNLTLMLLPPPWCSPCAGVFRPQMSMPDLLHTLQHSCFKLQV